jgi:hypothetical protein
MELSSTAPVNVNELLALVPAPGSWSFAQRLRIVREGNPNFKRGRWSRWRSKTEHQLESWSRQIPRLVGMTEAIAGARADGPQLVALASALGAMTPATLGALIDTRPGRTPSKWRTHYYVPAAAMPAVRAWIAACRWLNRHLHRVIGLARHWLRGLLGAAREGSRRVDSLPKKVTSPYPSGRKELQISAEPGSWVEAAARIARRIEADVGDVPPPTTT